MASKTNQSSKGPAGGAAGNRHSYRDPAVRYRFFWVLI